jgi:hypothetical protein
MMSLPWLWSSTWSVCPFFSAVHGEEGRLCCWTMCLPSGLLGTLSKLICMPLSPVSTHNKHCLTLLLSFLMPVQSSENSLFGLGYEVRALRLLGRCSTTWTMPPVLFVLVILGTGSHFLPRPAWITIFLFYASIVAGTISIYHHAQPFLLTWGVENCLPRVPGTAILPVSAS